MSLNPPGGSLYVGLKTLAIVWQKKKSEAVREGREGRRGKKKKKRKRSPRWTAFTSHKAERGNQRSGEVLYQSKVRAMPTRVPVPSPSSNHHNHGVSSGPGKEKGKKKLSLAEAEIVDICNAKPSEWIYFYSSLCCRCRGSIYTAIKSDSTVRLKRK